MLKFAVVAAFSFFVVALARAESPADGPYKVTQTLQIGEAGGWDYLTVDSENKKLYVPRSTHTMVIDAASGKSVGDIPGQQHNHGVAIVPTAGRGFITDGGGAIVIFDLKTNEALGKLDAPKDADGIIFDEASGKVLAVSGDEGVLIVVPPDVDAKNGKVEKIELGGKPEFLASDGKGKAFVNLQDKDQVAVVDTKAMKVLHHWPVAPGGSPVGMAIDPEHRRLFIGCRKPQKLIVMSADDGKVQADLPIGAGVDATKFDDGYALASCRDGTLAVAKETSPGKFEIVQTVQTKPGARTMGVDAATHTIYLPTAEMQPAAGGGRQTPKPDTFMILVVKRE